MQSSFTIRDWRHACRYHALPIRSPRPPRWGPQQLLGHPTRTRDTHLQSLVNGGATIKLKSGRVSLGVVIRKGHVEGDPVVALVGDVDEALPQQVVKLHEHVTYGRQGPELVLQSVGAQVRRGGHSLQRKSVATLEVGDSQ